MNPATRPDDPERSGGIQVIARAAAVLRALKDVPTGLSLAQIAERVGLARSTVQRIVQALQAERMVIASAVGGVRLGPELQSLADAGRHSTVERCRPLLERIVEMTGETVDLSVLRGDRMIFLDQVQGTHRLRTVSHVGEVFPLTTTANGRACLALMDEATARRLAETEAGRLPDHCAWEALAARLAEARASGVAEDDGDHSAGISALGIGFRDLSGDLHAISVPVPSSRYGAQKPAVRRALLDLRADLARNFGA